MGGTPNTSNQMKQQPEDTRALSEMLIINREQKAYYEPKPVVSRKTQEDVTSKSLEAQGNVITRLWRRVRWRLWSIRNELGIDAQIYDLHWEWMGNLSEKSVLDLGCFSGNTLSLAIAEKSKSYLGIDLSEVAIQELSRKLDEHGFSHAQAKAVDFLSDDFGTETYDIIYAQSVLHHFKYFDAFLKKLASHLAPGGRIISYDPMQTALSLRIARGLYRPFQSDSAWEWPFKKTTFAVIKRHFNIVAMQGVLGYAKWALLISLFNMKAAIKLGKKWHAGDFAQARNLNHRLWSCVHVTLCLEHKEGASAGE